MPLHTATHENVVAAQGHLNKWYNGAAGKSDGPLGLPGSDNLPPCVRPAVLAEPYGGTIENTVDKVTNDICTAK